MCILFIFTDPNPQVGGYRLIVASNRDEFYSRHAKTAFLCPSTRIIGGRDMEPNREGGMWLGASAKNKFRFGALLNVTGEENKHVELGRGPIVYNYLESDLQVADYLKKLSPNEYNAFNFVAVELADNQAVVSHFSNAPEACSLFQGRQVLGFGNSTVDNPLSKVRDGTKMFEEVIAKSEGEAELIEALIGLLKRDERHLPDPELQRRAPETYERLSAIFVRMAQAGYGTRTHSVLLVDFHWNIKFVEHTMREPIDALCPQWEISTISAHL